MADVSKIKLPDNSVVNIKDARITGVDSTPTSGSTNVVTSGGVYDSIQSAVGNAIAVYDVEDGGSTTAGTWLGSCPSITAYTDGLTIRYKLHVAGASTTTLNINGLGAKTVYRVGSTKLTTHYPVNSYLILYYAANLQRGSWQVYTDYDANTNTYVRQYQAGKNAAGTAPKYPLLARYTVTNHSGSYEASYARYHTDATVDTSTGEIEANGFIKTGGTSSQFLKADGSVDSNAYLPLTGGTMTGAITFANANNTVVGLQATNAGGTELNNLDIGWSWSGGAGAGVALRSSTATASGSGPGSFDIYARSGTAAAKTRHLIGKPDGTLSWGGSFTATSIIKDGGTSSQFLKADGSVDSNTYALASAIPTVDTTPTSGSTNAVSSGGVYSMITQNEQDVAQALNNINNRVSQIEDGTISSDRLTQQEVINLLNL